MQIEIKTVEDIVASRSLAKEMAKEIGFGIVDQTKIATVISELTRNIIKYAVEGLLQISIIESINRKGLEIICEDRGPGIADIELALKPGYSTSRGLGMGLPGAKKLMDELEVSSEMGKGTRITARKWL
ncbi:MAG: anti-sigma regulatory factor [Deltaproteobacteria bacterium]|nr:anti-sigma regulatory factor [Deltaproteobacteria bacterium]